MIRRPVAGETEEDLIRSQEEFLKAKEGTSVSVLRRTQGGARRDEAPGKSAHEPEIVLTKGLSVCGDIVERAVVVGGGGGDDVAKPPEAPAAGGFPEVFKIDADAGQRDPVLPKKKGGKSLFALDMAKKRAERAAHGVEKATATTAVPMEVDGSARTGSRILEATAVLERQDVEEIHEENVRKLAAMSVEEVRAEQAALAASLDPKTLEFLKSLRKKRATATGTESDGASSDKSRRVEDGSPTVLGDQTEEPAPDLDRDREEVVKALPIGPDEARSKFVHMSEVEYEKLRWITDLPAPEAKPHGAGGTQRQARFDFKGNLLLDSDRDLPVTRGLHHHGEEPEKPGYSLSELFTLSRSAFAAQKVVGLNVLAEVFRKANAGYFDGVFEQNIVEQVLESGCLFLLRFNLDENAGEVLPAAINALHGLIVNEFDEICLDRAFGPAELSCQPSLPSGVVVDEHSKREIAEDGGERSLKDAELLRLDVVKALIRMNIMPRLRYILTQVRPSPPAVIHCLELLTRIARQSLESCNDIVDTPGLMEVILNQFLPCTSFTSAVPPSQLTNVYGVPLRHALKLVRVLASRSRSLAMKFYRDFNIMEVVTSYVSFDPSEMGLPLKEALRLSLESYRLWTVLLMYGLADEEFLSLYPILMRQLAYYEWKVSVNVNVHENEFNYDLGASLIGLFEEAVYVAASRDAILKDPKLRKEHGVPAISFDHLTSVSLSAKTVVHKWTAELLMEGEAVSFSGWKMIGAAYRLVTAMASCSLRSDQPEAFKWRCSMEEITSGFLRKFLSSSRMLSIIDDLSKVMDELKSRSPGTRRDAKNLPSLGAVRWTGDGGGGKGLVPPLLADSSSVFFWDSLCRFLAFVVRSSPGVGSVNVEVLKTLWNGGEMERLASSFCGLAGSSSNEWFFRMLIQSMFSCVKIACHLEAGVGVFCGVGLNLVSQFQAGQQHLLRELLDVHLFQKESYGVPPANVQSDETATWFAAMNSFSCGSQIRKLFMSVLVDASADVWLNVAEGRTFCVETLCAPNSGSSVVPQDWIFLPIWAIHSTSVDMGSSYATFRALYPDELAVTAIALNLMWINFVNTSSPQFVRKTAASTIFCRLGLIFLAGDNYFLEEKVRPLLRLVLQQLLVRLVDLNKPVPGLTSLLDFYSDVVDQFSAVSYGDVIFQNYVLIGMQSHQDVAYRRLIWGEKSAALSLLRLRETDLMFPASLLTARKDTDEELLTLYRSALQTGLVRADRQPVLHGIAAFHLSTAFKPGSV